MNQVVANSYEVIDLNNNSNGLDKVESIATLEEEFFDALEEQESIHDLEEREEFFDTKAAAFNVPLSIFHYKDYSSDFFTSWYNISSKIFEEINHACPEKKILNLALSVLMLPYIAFTALGLAVYSRFKANGKKQEDIGEDKTKKSETGVPKRLVYGALAAIAIFVNVTVLVALIVPATVALATFYLLNRDLSHSLVAALKISMGQYSNKHQNIEVSFHETEVFRTSITYDMEIKFPPQFKQLLRDLCKNEDNKWFSVTRDSEHNIVLKLSTNIDFKNGLQPLRNEIGSVIATSIQEFAKTMEELMSLEKKEVTYDKLKELLNEFRLKVVDSIGPKLTTHLIENAYQVAFIQAIKFQQNRRGENFSLKDEIKNTLVKQELESQGKELPSKKEMIIKDMKSIGIKVQENLKDDEFSVYEADWKQLIEEGKIVKKTIIDIYKSIHHKETVEALRKVEETVKELEKMGGERYGNIREELKKLHENRENSNLEADALKRKLEDLFKFEYDVEQKLIESRVRTIQAILSESDNEVKQSLAGDCNEIKTPDKVNEFVTKMYLEIKKYKVQRLLKEQKEGVLDLCGILKRYNESGLAKIIEDFRMQDEGYLEESTLEQTLKDQNKHLQAKQNNREKWDPIVKLIEVLLKRNEAILETLKQLELEEKGLLINEETRNDYREELESREKIKFAIIEDKLLEIIKASKKDELLKIMGEAFNKSKLLEIKKTSEDEQLKIIRQAAIKELLEKAELEYFLAEKCIKSPVIKTKDNIKHFCQDLLSPLVDRLANLIINNVPKDNEGGLWRIWNSLKIGFNYNVIGWSATVNKDKSTEGKALSVARDTHKEVETFLQCFQSSYEEVGTFLGNLFSDDGTTFKNDVWPKVEEHLHGMWDRFFKDIEFKIGNKLDEVNVTQQRQETMIKA